MNILGILSYAWSHHQNRLPKLWAIYLKSCGLLAREFDALHALGLTMNHKWSTEAFGTIAEHAMEDMQSAVRPTTQSTFLISYDNVNIPKWVFSM
jgi:hypothetical protein